MFHFKANYVIHEGNTKYYQVFKITNDVLGRSVVVHHWGAYSMGAPRAPKLHRGNMEILSFDKTVYADTAFDKKVREKTKRDYIDWNTIEKRIDVTGESDLHDMTNLIDEWFPRVEREKILSHIMPTNDEMDDYLAEPPESDDEAFHPDEDWEALEVEESNNKDAERKQMLENLDWGQY